MVVIKKTEQIKNTHRNNRYICGKVPLFLTESLSQSKLIKI